MRVAWFSPMPPVRSGIAACSADLVAGLRAEHEIDVYVDEPSLSRRSLGEGGPRRSLSGGGSRRSLGEGGPLNSPHDFVWRHRQHPYDLTVYQLGNSSHHDYQWPYLFRYPGMAVLHDAHLHHARAAALLRTRRAADYRTEFAANHPGVNPDLAEVAVAGFNNHLYYAWPMRRLVVAASRLTAVHTPALADELRDEVPGARVEAIRLGHGVAAAVGPEARARIRAALGISEHAVVFGVFGGLTPEKRVPQILDAFRALLPYCPDAHLLLAGAPASHYDLHANVGSDLVRHVTMTGYITDDRALTETLAAADVALNLRWPTAREMSGPWLRALAAGVATVTIDLAHTAHIPSLDPRTWQPNEPAGPPPVTVAIDILDEDHSLRRAMRRLASDPALRATLAAAGRAFWEREHSVERMLEDYRRVLPIAAATAAPTPLLPPHMVTDGDRVLRGLLRDFGAVESAVRIWGTLGLGVEKA